MKNYQWIDRQGVSHGDWCRERFLEFTCKYCKNIAWYFQCSHGCRVCFHEVPWVHGKWNPRCPVYHAHKFSNDFHYILNDNEEFDYKIKNKDLDNFNYDLSENRKDKFKYNLDEEKDDFNYRLE